MNLKPLPTSLLRLVVILLLGAVAVPSATSQASAAPSQQHAHCCVAANPGPAGAIVPQPFLKLPFRERDGRDSLIISNGWLTATDEEPFTSPGRHGALDFEFTRQHDHGYGLPVVAAADGRAYFTYQNLTGPWVDAQGVTHRIGLGAGLVVEVRHANGFVTQYIHLSTVAQGLPYLQPEPDPDVPGDWIPSGLFQSNDALWALGVPVHAGQFLGTQGDTGIGLDWNDNFNPATGKVAPRDRRALPPWDPTQLHFQVYMGRDDNAVKRNIIDPSGGYWQIGTSAHNQYTPRPGTFCTGPTSLWLTDQHGQLLYAA